MYLQQYQAALTAIPDYGFTHKLLSMTVQNSYRQLSYTRGIYENMGGGFSRTG